VASIQNLKRNRNRNGDSVQKMPKNVLFSSLPQPTRGIVVNAVIERNVNKVNQTHPRRRLIRVSVAAFIFVAGCATLQTEQDVQDGRVALLTGRPDDAVKYFSRAAESNPNYKTPYVLRESV
jgi:hypothetical protein